MGNFKFKILIHMKLTFLTLLTLGSVEAASFCRNDTYCSNNWVKKKCCSHFQCNAYCNTVRCRTDTCGRTKCFKTAAEFRTTIIPAVPAGPAIPARPAGYDAWGRPIMARPAVPVHVYTPQRTCSF